MKKKLENTLLYETLYTNPNNRERVSRQANFCWNCGSPDPGHFCPSCGKKVMDGFPQ